MNTADLLIIGAGPGGYETAAEAAADGLSVTLIEKGELGGTCLNRGCIPTKCLLASAEKIRSAREAAAFGAEVGEVKVRFDVAAARMRQVMDQLRQGVAMVLKGVNVVKGEAVIERLPGGMLCAKVGDEAYTAPRVIIATGSKPAMLPIEGAELAMTSDDVLALEQLPRSMVIIGGGVIGMEFACILNSFGVDTTVIEYCPEILPPFDREVAKRLRSSLSRQGVKIIVGAAVKSIARTDDGGVTVAYDTKKGPAVAEAQAAVMAVGRKAVVPAGAAEAGIELDKRGFISTGSGYQTSVPGVYAIGDVNGKCMLAHAASAQGRQVLACQVCMDQMPSAVFTIPECAMVGLTEEALKELGIAYKAGKAMFAGNGKALSMGQGEGFVKVLADATTGALLGTHVIGPHASDIVAEATVCAARGVTAEDVAIEIVHGHPTLSEAFAAACRAAMPV